MANDKIYIEKEIPGSEWVALHDIVSRSDTIGEIRRFFEKEKQNKKPINLNDLEINIIKIISNMPYLYIDGNALKKEVINDGNSEY